jgi:hypothetical protein
MLIYTPLSMIIFILLFPFGFYWGAMAIRNLRPEYANDQWLFFKPLGVLYRAKFFTEKGNRYRRKALWVTHIAFVILVLGVFLPMWITGHYI